MAPISMIFVLAALVVVSQQVLTYSDLTTSTWKFYNDAGYLGTLSFGTNGKIVGYSNPNEYTWLLNSSNMLEVYDNKGKITVRYVLAFKDHYGKWRL